MENSFEGYDLQGRIISINFENIEFILMTDGKYHYYNEEGQLITLKDENTIKKINDFITIRTDEGF